MLSLPLLLLINTIQIIKILQIFYAINEKEKYLTNFFSCRKLFLNKEKKFNKLNGFCCELTTSASVVFAVTTTLGYQKMFGT